MFTDFYFTNLYSKDNHESIVFFQKKITETLINTITFGKIENCQYNWSHKTRVFWDLRFRFLKASGNTSEFYDFKNIYNLQNKFFLISRDGIFSFQQSYSNGKQIIDFEQIKGNSVIGIQFYRAEFFIGEQFFTGKQLRFHIDTIISIAQSGQKCIDEKRSFYLDLDFTSLKSVYLTLIGNTDSGNKILIDRVEKW